MCGGGEILLQTDLSTMKLISKERNKMKMKKNTPKVFAQNESYSLNEY